MTSQGKVKTHTFCSDSIEELINENCSILSQLEKEGQTQIKKIVYMWAGNAVDIPSFQFRKELCELNSENYNTEVLLYAGGNNYAIKKIADLF